LSVPASKQGTRSADDIVYFFSEYEEHVLQQSKDPKNPGKVEVVVVTKGCDLCM
jgi:hypothetical protein